MYSYKKNYITAHYLTHHHILHHNRSFIFSLHLQMPKHICPVVYKNGVILGLAISSVTTSSFLQERGETGARVYQEDVLKGVAKHLNMTFFSGEEWVFQQDSVPVQNATTTQEWLQRNLLAFISAENWLLGSADLKTLDIKLWAVLEDIVCQKCHNSL